MKIDDIEKEHEADRQDFSRNSSWRDLSAILGRESALIAALIAMVKQLEADKAELVGALNDVHRRMKKYAVYTGDWTDNPVIQEATAEKVVISALAKHGGSHE